MSWTTLPVNLLNAAVVFVGLRRVSQHARETGQNREAIYRDAHQVQQQFEDGLHKQQQLQLENDRLRNEIQQLKDAAEYNPFTDPDKVDKYAAMAQAEGVSLPVAQRLLKNLQANTPRP